MSAAALVDAIPNLAGAAMLLLGLLLPTRRRREAAARLAAWQGGLLALAAASAAWAGTAGPLLWIVAFGALAGRALPLPALLGLAAGRAGGDASPGATGAATPRASGAAVSLLAGGALAVLAVAAVVPAGAGVAPGTREGIALALAVLLLGLLTTSLQRGVPFGLLGLMAAENGALLGLVHAGAGAPPGAAVLAVLSPGLGACVLLAARGARGVSAGSLLQAWRR